MYVRQFSFSEKEYIIINYRGIRIKCVCAYIRFGQCVKPSLPTYNAKGNLLVSLERDGSIISYGTGQQIKNLMNIMNVPLKPLDNKLQHLADSQ